MMQNELERTYNIELKITWTIKSIVLIHVALSEHECVVSLHSLISDKKEW